MRQLTVVPIGQVHTDTIHTVKSKTMNAEIELIFDERAVRSLSDAVEYTLDRWDGREFNGGIMDQEELLTLKPFLRGALLEAQFKKPALGE